MKCLQDYRCCTTHQNDSPVFKLTGEAHSSGGGGGAAAAAEGGGGARAGGGQGGEGVVGEEQEMFCKKNYGEFAQVLGFRVWDSGFRTQAIRRRG